MVLTPNRSAVVNDLEVDQVGQDRPVVSYFVDTASNQQVTATEILRALVKQLMLLHEASRKDHSQGIQDSIRTCLSVTDEVLTFAILTKLVIAIARELGGCTFVIDGIDAMQEHEVLAFLRFLSEVFEASPGPPAGCKLILFCRETLGRGIRLESIPQSCIFYNETNHVRSDIHFYIDHEIERNQRERCITNDNVLLHEVSRVLKENADKM